MLINTTYVTPSIDSADPCTSGDFIDKAKEVAPKVALGGLGVYAGYRVVKGLRDWWNEDSTKSTKTAEKPADPQPAPAPQPTPAPAPQPDFVTKADLKEFAEELVKHFANPQPAPNPAPQPEFVTKADLDKKIEEMTASVTEALKNAQEASTIKIDDSAIEKIAEKLAAKSSNENPAPQPAPNPAPQPEVKAKKSAK